MRAVGKYFLRWVPASFGKLWRTRDELGVSQIRLRYLTYMLPLVILLILHDLRSTYFTTSDTFLKSDMVTLDYATFAIGAIVVLLFIMKKIIDGMRGMTAVLVAGFVLWLLLPQGDMKNISMLVFNFGIGACTIYAVYTHVFILKNAERLFSMCIVALVYGLFLFLYHNGIGGPALSYVVPGVLVAALVLCVFFFKTEAFPDNSPPASVTPPVSIYIVLIYPFAFFIMDVFGEALVGQSVAGNIALRGIGTMAAVLLAIILQFGFRRNAWFMLNLFLIFTAAGIFLLFLPVNEPQYAAMGSFLFGIGDGIGYIMIFYVIGIIKKYRNDKFFWRITLSTIGAIFLSVLTETILEQTDPQMVAATAVIFAIAFLFAFQLLSPVIQRNLFATDWIDDLSKPDISYTMKTVECADRLGNLGLSPREKEVTVQLLHGLSMRQIAGALGVKESTVKGYCKTLYKKLGINSRVELFVRFGVTGSNTPKEK